jgi:hypothetical protein
MRYERCFNAAIKALERLDSVRYMWNGPIIQAVVFLREATGPQPDAAPDAGAPSGREVPAAAPVAAPLPEALPPEDEQLRSLRAFMGDSFVDNNRELIDRAIADLKRTGPQGDRT